ncbi:phage tail assembly chaperone GT, partial [Mammaliicoccus sciuri]
VKKGDKDINDVLNTPFYFFVQELNEQSKVIKKEESMLDAFM